MYRLIIIDDDAGTSNKLGNYFPWEEHGFQVTEKFYDGYSACQYLKNNSVDLILSDIKMPVMDGIELAKWLWEGKRREKIIFISGYKDFDYAQKAMEYGVSYYCLKPVTYPEIKQKLANIRQILDHDSFMEIKLPEETNEESIKQKQIKRMKNYIGSNYRDVTLEGLAEHMRKNPTYLSRFFKENAGINLFHYITEVRMKKALELLRNEDFSTVYEIGEKVGYGNAVSFSKAFHKLYGVSPSEYRNKFSRISKGCRT